MRSERPFLSCSSNSLHLASHHFSLALSVSVRRALFSLQYSFLVTEWPSGLSVRLLCCNRLRGRGSIPSAGRVSSKLITAAPVHQSSINLVLAERLGSKANVLAFTPAP